MANGSLTSIMPKILSRGLAVLRELAVVTKYVNTDYGTDAKQKGDTVNVPVSSAVAVYNVTPSNVSPAPGSSTPTTIPIALSNWKGASFYLTDKNLAEIDKEQSFLPMQMEEAIRALANQLNTDVLSLYQQVYGYSGTAGTTPFASSPVDATNTGRILNVQLAPPDRRAFLLDPFALANAQNLSAFQYVNQGGNDGVMRDGQLGRRLGFNFDMSQLMPVQTAGTQTATVTVAGTAGTTTLTVTTGSGAALNLNPGDIITIAGDTQTYVCPLGCTIGASQSSATITVAPALKTTPAGAAITIKATHTVNLAFHRDAFALAIRPLADEIRGLPNTGLTMTMVDKVSGIPLRLDFYQQYKQWVWEFTVLYGFACVRPQLAARLAG